MGKHTTVILTCNSGRFVLESSLSSTPWPGFWGWFWSFLKNQSHARPLVPKVTLGSPQHAKQQKLRLIAKFHIGRKGKYESNRLQVTKGRRLVEQTRRCRSDGEIRGKIFTATGMTPGLPASVGNPNSPPYTQYAPLYSQPKIVCGRKKKNLLVLTSVNIVNNCNYICIYTKPIWGTWVAVS